MGFVRILLRFSENGKIVKDGEKLAGTFNKYILQLGEIYLRFSYNGGMVIGGEKLASTLKRYIVQLEQIPSAP